MNAEITDKENVNRWICFDSDCWLSRRIGYQATNLVFVYLPVIYLLAAWKGTK